MTASDAPREPLLVIVTGLPASGKSTLAALIARALGLPLFGKDMVKEILFDALGVGDRPWSRRLGAASTAVLLRIVEAELEARRSCVVESNFSPALDAPRLAELRGRLPYTPAQVLCVADGQVLLRRFRERRRHPGHLDDLLASELEPQLLAGRLAPLALGGPVFEVDTTDPAAVDAAALVARLRALAPSPD